MHAGKNICIGVGVVGHLEEPGAEVLPGHCFGPQILPIGHQRAEDGSGCKGDGDEPHVPPEALRVLQNQEYAQHKQHRPPTVIWDGKIFHKRDVVVDDRLGGPVIVGYEMLNGKEHDEIDRQIKAPPHMLVGINEVLDGLHEFPPSIRPCCFAIIPHSPPDAIVRTHLSLFFNKFRAGRLRKRVRVYYTVFICHILRRSTVCCCIGKTKKTAGWY